ncbi:hypothetical protein [Brevibacterium marinum]|uniref:Uncharacterized protein n=1 Tax=Brevibacterium marinum TaxID=418643 RepID=A0A846S3M0_9MICO|nr:hypothetical protein [Brevibacterium marinum]NJC58150.1 hypothetical protein [Brevibacterium marinum]
MTNVLLTPQRPPLPVGGLDDAASTPGPAVVFSSPTDADVSGTEHREAPRRHDTESALAVRPVAYRESEGPWHQLGYEAADHWQGLSTELRERLIADRTAPLSVAEYSATTNGASASMITNNWVHSGSPRMYRVAGELRELTEVLAEILTS